MRVIRRELRGLSGGARLNLYPIGDVHIGAKACNEGMLKQAVRQIERDPYGYWIGVGDYIEGINRKDKRFDPQTLADWITVRDLTDLGRAQADRFLEFVRPIAHKCLGLASGNHDETAELIWERDLIGDIVTGVKQAGGMAQDEPLRLGYYGYILLSCIRGESHKDGSRLLRLGVHHGAGGANAGGAINRLREWLYTHECDVFFVGHTHNTESTTATVEEWDAAGRLRPVTRYGVICSTFLRSSEEGITTYGERRMLKPTHVGRTMVTVKPFSDKGDRIKVTIW